MKLLKLLIQESPQKALMIVVTSLLAGISGGLIVPLVIYAVKHIVAGRFYWRYAVGLTFVAVVFVLTKRIAQIQAAQLTEQVLEKLTIRLINTLRHAELVEFEQLERADMYEKLVNAQTITNAATKAIDVFQNLLIMLVCWVYLFRISPLSGFIFMASLLLVVLVLEVFQKLVAPLVHQQTDSETRLFRSFTHIFNGFKELKLNRQKNDDLFHHYLSPLIETTRGISTKILFYFSEESLFVLACLYLVLAANVFFLSEWYSYTTLLEFLTMLLYLTTPVMIIHDALPYITNGKVAFQRLLQVLETTQPERDVNGVLYHPSRQIIQEVEEIAVEDICFKYHAEDEASGFAIGPLNLTIHGGEILFISGGNGSGKTTLLKVLSGLYPPTFGSVRLNGRPVDMARYRYLFAAVFADFHLFDCLYGIDDIDEDALRKLLAQMELGDQVEWRDGGFSTLALSTGQRKRLALIVALLEKKSLYIFDEWAADQDPHFRKYFYEELLPSLKKQGKTIIAVTHDDHYFYMADRVIKMEYGKIVEEWSKQEPISEIPQIFTPTHLPVTSAVSDSPPSPEQSSTESSAETSSYEPEEEPARQKTLEDHLLQFWQTVKAMPKESLNPILRMAALAGLFDTLMVVILYSAVNLPITGTTDRLFFIFIITVLLYIICFRRFNQRLFQFVQDQIARIRSKTLDRLRNTDLQSFEAIGVEAMYTVLTFDVKAISDISHLLANSVQVSIYTAGLFIYLFFLSKSACLLILAMIGAAGYVYWRNQCAISEDIHQVRRQQKQVFDAVADLLNGFKELKLNNKKSDDFFYKGFIVQTAQLKQVKLRLAQRFINNYTFSYSLWQMLILGSVLLLPLLAGISHVLLITVIGIILFLPLSLLVEHFPLLVIAGISLQRLHQIQHTLESLEAETPESVESAKTAVVQELHYRDLTFQYREGGRHPFSVGPLSLSVHVGEIVFLTGGNGSGKTTLIKMLMGLYPAHSGEIRLNGQRIGIAQHRALFSSVFSDFHLFDRLYGIPVMNEERVQKLLRQMQLDQAVRLIDNRFSTLSLSTGQQRRLALIAAMMEDKPVYVFDEWAADQDPHFRAYFYLTLLPELKAAGKIVIAVSHDDRYFHAADRIIRMEYGQIA